MKNVMRIPFLVFFFLLSLLPFRRRSLQPLVVALALVACSEPPDGNPPVPVDDAGQPLQPDAIVGSTDIRPPISPDDPCRQLKLPFEVEILSADAAYLGELLVVAYQTQTETAVATYRRELLENVWPLPAGQPKLFYSRDELHVTVGSRGDADNRVFEILPNSAPRVVLEEEVGTFETVWHVTGDVSDRDDLLVSHWSAAFGGGSTQINGNYSYGSGPEGFFFVRGGAGDWWPVRVGTGADAVVVAAEIGMVTNQDGSTALASRHVRHSIAGGEGVGTDPGRIPFQRPVSFAVLSAVLETQDELIVAMDFREGPDHIEYNRTVVGSSVLEEVSQVPAARLATYGTNFGDYASGRVQALFVEHRTSEDGLSGTWHLVEPSTGTTLAVAREGLAGEPGNPGSLIRVGDSVMWAGPTIRDVNTSNYPADAIAVCSYKP